MTATKAGWISAALFLIALYVTNDYLDPPRPYQNVDPAVRKYLDTEVKPRPLAPVVALWALFVLSAVSAIYLGYCEEEERTEATRQQPRAADPPAPPTSPGPLNKFN